MTTRIDLPGERWLDIIGFSKYQISDHGRIWNKDKNMFMKTHLNKQGYPQLQLVKKFERKMKSVHQLVAEHFVPNTTNRPQVNHVDGNKANPHFSNLEWVTAKENTNHAITHGLRGGTSHPEVFEECDAWLDI